MNRGGFSLLELVIVCGLVALGSALVLPRLAHDGDRALSTSARRLADALSLARDRAMLRSRAATIVFDLDAQRWRVDDATAPVTLPAGVRFAAVIIGDRPAITRGAVTLTVQPAGDPFTSLVDLRDDDGHASRVVLPPARARATVLARERS